MPNRIVIANRVHSSVVQRLQAYGDLVLNETEFPLSAEELRRRCSDARAVMAFMTERVDEEFLSACPHLKILAGALKGYNNFDVDACTRRNICVTVVPDLLTEPTAELTVGLIIAILRNFGPGDRHIRSGQFHGWRPSLYGSTLDGAIVGVLGAGAVGQATLRMLSGFNCERIYYDPHRLGEDTEAFLKCRFVDQSILIREADILVLAVHLMDYNRRLVNDDFIGMMKEGAYLINPARGSVVDERAVADALDKGRLSGYAADTFELEDWQLDDRPREVDARLLASDQTIFTPHIGSGVRSVREAIEQEAAENIIDALTGKRPRGLVNPRVWRE